VETEAQEQPKSRLLGLLTAAISLLGAMSALLGVFIRTRPRLLVEINPDLPHRDLTMRPWRIVAGTQQMRKERYYHLRLSNARRGGLAAAHEARVVMRAVEVESPDGSSQVVFAGVLPLRWSHHEMWPEARTVGPPALADLLFVAEDSSLQITPIRMPYSFPNLGRFLGPTKLWITVQAQSVETESRPVRIEVVWDGQWDEDENIMANHLRISIVNH
jgi:hypothetical protein